MAGDHEEELQSRASRILRRVGLDRNPLRRRWDRTETLILLIALASGLLAVPFAAAVGSNVLWSESLAANHQLAEARPMTAHTTRDTPSAGTSPVIVSRVPAIWIDGNGSEHEVAVPVPPGATSGTEVTIWIDSSGSVVAPPLTRTQIGMHAVGAALTTLLEMWLALALAYVTGRWALNLRRYHAWQAEWRRIEPAWTGRHR